mmetsp:Transcript_8434/g.11600  ORF Transcript_8434/g.11600 Transcript_8434/m.11600 type:complete len:322 (+) Transcript_8434:733-1698(+)
MDYQGRKQVVKEMPKSELENLIISYSFVTIRSSVSGAFKNEFREIQYSTYLLNSRTKRKRMARIRIGSEQRIKATEVLFENIEIPGEGFTLPELAERCLRKCPSDIRSGIIGNIFFSGGGASIPGLYDRFIMELDLLLVRRTTELTPLAGRFGITKSRIPSVIRSWLGSSVLCKAGLNEEYFQQKTYKNLREVPDWTNPPLESPDSIDDNEEHLIGEAGEDKDVKREKKNSTNVKSGAGSSSRVHVKNEEKVKIPESKALSALERFRLAAGAAAEASSSPTGSPMKISSLPSELPQTLGVSKLKLASSRLRMGTTRTQSNT